MTYFTPKVDITLFWHSDFQFDSVASTPANAERLSRKQ